MLYGLLDFGSFPSSSGSISLTAALTRTETGWILLQTTGNREGSRYRGWARGPARPLAREPSWPAARAALIAAPAFGICRICRWHGDPDRKREILLSHGEICRSNKTAYFVASCCWDHVTGDPPHIAARHLPAAKFLPNLLGNAQVILLFPGRKAAWSLARLTINAQTPAQNGHYHVPVFAEVLKTDPSLDELRRTSIATMAEHNIVVFAGDHCGPEVTHYPRAFPPLTLAGERLTLVI